MPAHYLDREAAAAYLREKHGLRCETSLLRYRACVGGGPIFRKISRFAAYTIADLDAWAATQISRPISKASELRQKDKAA